ncbi:MAG: hypothetical protein CUN56_16135, partial [Phototrophicales bacterium]
SNIGIVHGEVSGNYITIDIDHDNGIFARLIDVFPPLGFGRIEQSGSGEGYHIPLRLITMPTWNNKTWKTSQGIVNIRARRCQTVAPPSIHPTGGVYKFIQIGDIEYIENVAAIEHWLDEISPRKRHTQQECAPTTEKKHTNEETL